MKEVGGGGHFSQQFWDEEGGSGVKEAGKT